MVASTKDADNKLKLLLQKKLSCVLSEEEFIECRYSLIKLGQALTRWHEISYGRKNARIC